MRKTIIGLFSIAILLTACGPLKTVVNVESQGDAEHLISMGGRKIGVVSVSSVDHRDSALVSELGLGVAEKIEVEMGAEPGIVGVYSLPTEGGDIVGDGTLDLLAVQTDRDMFIVIDSLNVGSYTSSRNTKGYYQNSSVNVVDVLLPITFKVLAYDVKRLETLYSRQVVDTVTWSVMGEGEILNSTAIAQANAHLKEAFRGLGESVSMIFLPTWNQEERMIVCYSGSKWTNAYYLASDFKWEQAMEVWLELVKRGGPQKQGAAAYNLAVACEILGRYDTALKWLDYAETKCYFSQMTTLRKKLLASLAAI